MKALIYNKKTVMESVHYAHNYAPFYVQVRYVDGSEFINTASCFRFFSVAEAIEHARYSVSQLGLEHRCYWFTFGVYVYRVGRRKCVKRVEIKCFSDGRVVVFD